MALTGKWHVVSNHGVTPSGRGFDHSLNFPNDGLYFANQTSPKGDTKMFVDDEQISREDPQYNPPWYASDSWTEQGSQFIDLAIAEKKPFFCYLAHVAPHFPCMAPESTIAKYRGRYMKGWNVLREERYARQMELFDMQADRTEQNNLAAESIVEVDALSRQWRQWARSTNALPKPM